MIVEGGIHNSLDHKDNYQLIKNDEVNLLGTIP
jgi:hypothetical protein